MIVTAKQFWTILMKIFDACVVKESRNMSSFVPF